MIFFTLGFIAAIPRMFNLNSAQRSPIVGAPAGKAFTATRFNRGLQGRHFLTNRLIKLSDIPKKCFVTHTQFYVALIHQPGGQAIAIK